jgi:hypothetical protein
VRFEVADTGIGIAREAQGLTSVVERWIELPR